VHGSAKISMATRNTLTAGRFQSERNRRLPRQPQSSQK
jgi:hypothetical protein